MPPKCLLSRSGPTWPLPGILSLCALCWPTVPLGTTTVTPMTQGPPNPVRDLGLGIVFVTTPPHWPLKKTLSPDADSSLVTGEASGSPDPQREQTAGVTEPHLEQSLLLNEAVAFQRPEVEV